jgi:hypothetical protein
MAGQGEGWRVAVGWRSPMVRGSGDPSATSRGGPMARDGGGEEQGLLAGKTSEAVLTVDMEQWR